ncbi:hypothetical protein FOMPIDRAFT_1052445 [Fomitopsis schrenkii]|uniref:F-box domain-containing protein n=1 Tax=Fomitopsis schrenkii TaxID=2126942 RepID=S8E216_FOMSC|nr:hypothetical protein FOMPIDRAFT_1052445 [Fomitopsis schrenkii]
MDSPADDNYDTIFRDCVLLRSLSISGHNLLEGFSAAAKVNPTALPYLSHLKIGIPYTPLDTTAHQALFDFVASKTMLRCFDYSDGCYSEVAKLAPLLSTLRSLPALETLGLDVMLENVEAFGTFVDGLPRHISALRLSFLYTASVQQRSCSPLLGLVGTLRA